MFEIADCDLKPRILEPRPCPLLIRFGEVLVAIFHRSSLAEELATHILDDDLAPASSGLFLGARRRTGSRPFSSRICVRSWSVVVPWSSMPISGTTSIGIPATSSSMPSGRRSIGMRAWWLRFARAAGMDKVSVGGASFSLDRVGLGQQVSLSKALSMLSDESGRMIVLIVDEAQHALTTEKGSNSLYALKAARDRLNMGPHHGLRIVATGSNRDKLAMLVEWKDQAFFCAPMREFPPMGDDYLRWIVSRSPASAGLSVGFLAPLFQRSGCRPEWMQPDSRPLSIGRIGRRMRPPRSLPARSSLARVSAREPAEAGRRAKSAAVRRAAGTRCPRWELRSVLDPDDGDLSTGHRTGRRKRD
ncbi:hypothetical protein Ddc_24281 [Ditylenchus destructor]|nr:hypothetical protein Ddc_24281 [Ditylenchus destructor]